MSALKPYWGKPAVRNFRGGYGNGGIMRSPLSAIALLDELENGKTGLFPDGPRSDRNSLPCGALVYDNFPAAYEAGGRCS